MNEPDVLVVGAGVVGVCSAWYLADAGHSVAVVDAGGIAAGCSHGNCGLIVPSHSIPMAAPGMIARGLRWMFNPESPFYIKFRFERALFSWLWKFRAACREERVRAAIPILRDLHRSSAALYDALAREPGMDCAYGREGLLAVYRTAVGMDHGTEEARLLGEFGQPVKTLDGEAARALVPSLRPGVVGAIHFPEDAHIDPGAFVRGLARRCEERGVRFLTETPVTGFERRGRTVTAVRTSMGDFHPRTIVLAAGSWSPGVARDLELRLPIQPAKGYSITLRAPAVHPRIPMLLMEARVGVTPLGSTLRLGGTLELAGMDLSINERRIGAIRRGASDYLEGTDDLEVLETWRGLRPCTPDGLPIVGRPKTLDNVVLATGHAMIGLSLGPVTGKIVADLVAGKTPDYDLKLLDPARF